MAVARKCVWSILFLLFLSVAPVAAQGIGAANALQLRSVMRPAGYIFAGRVIAIEYLHPKSADEVATVRITFRVEQGIRGTRTGSILTVREWAGLWNSGERYRVGERLLLFFYPPSRLGLTSLVGGPRGRFLVDHSGKVILPLLPGATRGSPETRHRDKVPLQEFVQAIRRAGTQEK